ncbi:Protein CBG23844 [Caenorhabditis briggsae]|uniref:Protein CBG23844 n=1 Tax=Caenorhabditis briggsae TaxID=6238 RepID=A8WJF4_CAEBR|nr:Protein CBG23844 [Caenorhabditis briggsae]CAP20596.2 Protein CBG23844 [Caenorhabditis briggsae]
MKGYKYCLCYLQLASFLTKCHMSLFCPGYYFFPLIAGYNTGAEITSPHLKVGGHEKNNVLEIPFKDAPRGVELVRAMIEGAAPLPTEPRGQRESARPIAYIKARTTDTNPPNRFLKKGCILLTHIFPFATSFAMWKSKLTYQQKYGLTLGVDTMVILQKHQKSMSRQMYQIHKTALFSLLMQLLIPGMLIVVPLSVCMFVVVTGAIGLQELAMDTMFLVGSHSMCSCAVMILSNPKYRKFVKEKILRLKVWDKKISMEQIHRGNGLFIVQGACFQQRVVSIHRPLGYGPSTLPLRHAADKRQLGGRKYMWGSENSITNEKRLL